MFQNRGFYTCQGTTRLAGRRHVFVLIESERRTKMMLPTAIHKDFCVKSTYSSTFAMAGKEDSGDERLERKRASPTAKFRRERSSAQRLLRPDRPWLLPGSAPASTGRPRPRVNPSRSRSSRARLPLIPHPIQRWHPAQTQPPSDPTGPRMGAYSAT